MSQTAVPDTSLKPGLGIAYALIAIACFSTMDALVKWESATYSVAQVIFFRSAFAFIPIAFAVWMSGSWDAIKVNDAWAHVWRALIGLCAMASVFTASSGIGGLRLGLTFRRRSWATSRSAPSVLIARFRTRPA